MEKWTKELVIRRRGNQDRQGLRGAVEVGREEEGPVGEGHDLYKSEPFVLRFHGQ